MIIFPVSAYQDFHGLQEVLFHFLHVISYWRNVPNLLRVSCLVHLFPASNKLLFINLQSWIWNHRFPMSTLCLACKLMRWSFTLVRWRWRASSVLNLYWADRANCRSECCFYLWCDHLIQCHFVLCTHFHLKLCSRLWGEIRRKTKSSLVSLHGCWVEWTAAVPRGYLCRRKRDPQVSKTGKCSAFSRKAATEHILDLVAGKHGSFELSAVWTFPVKKPS